MKIPQNVITDVKKIITNCILTLLVALCFPQTINASAKAGEAKVYEGCTQTIELSDAYTHTLRRSTNITYQWYSENSSYVQVVGEGRYYAIIKGIQPTRACRLYFKCSYFIDGFYRTMDFYYTITVESTSISVTEINLNKTSAEMNVGSTLQLYANLYPTNATNRSVSWTSSSTSVASVSSSGKVTAKSPGSAVITCRANDGSGCYATCVINVNQANILVKSITLDKTSATLTEGETLYLNETVYPTNATNKNVSWTSSSTSVASVSSSGKVTAKSPGSAVITCRANDGSGCYALCEITVEEGTKLPPEATVNWAGIYTVYSECFTSEATRDYTNNFNITIEEINGKYVITSMFGDDLTKYNNGGFVLKDNGDGTALIDISNDNILRYTNRDSYLYTLIVFDELTETIKNTWTLTMNDDGTIDVEDFYIASYAWIGGDTWKIVNVEAAYYNMCAKKNTVGIEQVEKDSVAFSIDNNIIHFLEQTEVRIYTINGKHVYTGKTDIIDFLTQGVYIIHTPHGSKKVYIRR